MRLSEIGNWNEEIGKIVEEYKKEREALELAGNFLAEPEREREPEKVRLLIKKGDYKIGNIDCKYFDKVNGNCKAIFSEDLKDPIVREKLAKDGLLEISNTYIGTGKESNYQRPVLVSSLMKEERKCDDCPRSRVWDKLDARSRQGERW